MTASPGLAEQSPFQGVGAAAGSRSQSNGRVVHRVDFVVPCQRVAGRTAASVSPCDIGRKRVMTLLGPFPALTLLGTFHSHPFDWRREGFSFPDCVEPSESDHSSWESWWDETEDDSAIELIMSMTELHRKARKKPAQIGGNCISGHWGKLRYALGAWHTSRAVAESGDDELLEAAHQLTCPMVWGITNMELNA